MEVIQTEFPDSNYLADDGVRILDKDQLTLLFEIVRCAVCFGIPRGDNLKFQICKQGHHFCMSCYKQLRSCAICRAELTTGRNFVVEELTNKLGSALALTTYQVQLTAGVSQLTPGLHKCLHQCSALLHAGQMLPHIRRMHSENLMEKVQSNSLTKKFDSVFQIVFTLNSASTFSMQVVDMGLFSVVININENYLLGTVHILGDESISSNYLYRLTARIPNGDCSHEFSVTNCKLFGHNTEIDNINSSLQCLKILVNQLCELTSTGESLKFLLSIYRNNELTKKNEENFRLITIQPKLPVMVNNDRNNRRNRQRNLRRKHLKNLRSTDLNQE